MTEFSTTPPNEPELSAIRSAEATILNVTDLTPKKAVWLGRGLIEAQRDYYQAYRRKHPETALINENIMRYVNILDAVDAGHTQGLGNLLRNRALDMLSDPAWIVRDDEMREFPNKLGQVAEAILKGK